MPKKDLLATYRKTTVRGLMALGILVLSGHSTKQEVVQYNRLHDQLLVELRGLNPQAKDDLSAAYLHGQITISLQNMQAAAIQAMEGSKQ